MASTSCYLEPNLGNINLCLASLYPGEYEEITSRKYEEIFRITGAKNQADRLSKIIEWLKKNEPIQCSSDLDFKISGELYAPPRGRDAGNFRMLQSPACVLRPGGSIFIHLLSVVRNL